MPKKVGSANERFSRSFVVDAVSQCWVWIGRKNPKGYGMVAGLVNGKQRGKRGQSLLAHRVSWMIFKGEIPDHESAHGYVVMHECDNPSCVNPQHLRLGLQADNVQDMLDKGRKVSGTPSGIKHWNSAIKVQSDIDLICSTVGETKALAEKYCVDVSTIKEIRRRNGVVVPDAARFLNKPLSAEAIAHIRSTKPGTRGLGKLYGVSKTTISKIRRRMIYAD